MNRHPLDPVSLLFGVIFAAVGVVYLLPGVGLGSLVSPRIWPILLVVLGVALIASTLRRRSDAANASSPDAPAGGEDSDDAETSGTEEASEPPPRSGSVGSEG